MNKLGNKNYDFRKAPTSDILLDPQHGGQVLCMSSNSNSVVQGSVDHGLRVYSITNGKQTRSLYTKQYGHTEWVTSCVILEDGRVVSTGMDSNICIWESKGVKCRYIKEHQGSISKVLADYNICLTSSYDSSILISDLNSASKLAVLCGVHKGPVTEFVWKNSLVASAGKDGLLAIWDLNVQKCISKQNVHSGQISNILFNADGIDNNLIISAGCNDGSISAIDMRTHERVVYKRVHKGSINFIGVNLSNILVTGSSDKTVKSFDMLNSFIEIGTGKTMDSVYCGDIYENFCIFGCGDGNIMAYVVDTMECLYGYGADSVGAVKCIKILPEAGRIVTGGDSGQGLLILI